MYVCMYVVNCGGYRKGVQVVVALLILDMLY